MLTAESGDNRGAIQTRFIAVLSVFALLYSSAVAAQNNSTESKFAIATVTGDPVPASSGIATHEIRSGNIVTPPGFPIGERSCF